MSTSSKWVGANGLRGREGLGLLSDHLGPLRSCVDLYDVIVFVDGWDDNGDGMWGLAQGHVRW